MHRNRKWARKCLTKLYTVQYSTCTIASVCSPNNRSRFSISFSFGAIPFCSFFSLLSVSVSVCYIHFLSILCSRCLHVFVKHVFVNCRQVCIKALCIRLCYFLFFLCIYAFQPMYKQTMVGEQMKAFSQNRISANLYINAEL